MSAWRLVTDVAVWPALVLTLLLVVPTPKVVKKGILRVTQAVLDFRIAGNFKLVHIMITMTGLAYLACCVHTYRLSMAVVDEALTLTPNQKTALLAKKWREERNHWIALLALLLWLCLNRFQTLMSSYMSLLDRDSALRAEVRALTTQLQALQGTVGAGVPAPQSTPPSAPPMSKEDALAAAVGGGSTPEPAAEPAAASSKGLVNRGKKKDT